MDDGAAADVVDNNTADGVDNNNNNNNADAGNNVGADEGGNNMEDVDNNNMADDNGGGIDQDDVPSTSQQSPVAQPPQTPTRDSMMGDVPPTPGSVIGSSQRVPDSQLYSQTGSEIARSPYGPWIHVNAPVMTLFISMWSVYRYSQQDSSYP
jgi:hypothetical protein